jgi:ribonucleoside-diphosphate reductase alpha chain
MTTSVIDFVFRDLAISYLKRNDLGQVKPEDLIATATKSETEISDGKPREDKQSVGFRPSATVSPSSAQAIGKTVKTAQERSDGSVRSDGNVHGNVRDTRSPSGSADGHGSVTKAAILQTQTQPQVMVMDSPYVEHSYPEESEVIKIVQARVKGYEGDPCTSCGAFTLVRSGVCMKCDSCGSTTGCS